LVLDVKSRHVPKRIWALIIDALRDAGVNVEGIASFIPEEIRGISTLCYKPTKEVVFLHSAGDLQKACHEGKIQQGDIVFFNAGSLLWDKRTFWNYSSESNNAGVMSCVRDSLWSCIVPFDAEEVKRNYELRPYSLWKNDEENGGCSTVRDYKKHYNLSIGLYCQEFAVDEVAIDIIVRYVNANLDVYDLGFGWGGINGITVRGIQPGRFTCTDGFWNQRYAGVSWDSSLWPGDEVVIDG